MGDWDDITRMDRMGEKADRVPAKTDGLRDRALGNWWGQPSSGNRAFDDYRAETLRPVSKTSNAIQGIPKTSVRCQGSCRIRPIHERSPPRRATRLQTRDLVELFPLRCHVADNGERNQAANGDLDCVHPACPQHPGSSPLAVGATPAPFEFKVSAFCSGVA